MKILWANLWRSFLITGFVVSSLFCTQKAFADDPGFGCAACFLFFCCETEPGCPQAFPVCGVVNGACSCR